MTARSAGWGRYTDLKVLGGVVTKITESQERIQRLEKHYNYTSDAMDHLHRAQQAVEALLQYVKGQSNVKVHPEVETGSDDRQHSHG